MDKNIYLSSGKFAEFCGTTKETLRHYHNKKILVPAKQEENGYFYYTINQYLIFELIQLLSNTGISLQQIKEYLNDYSIDNFMQLIQTSYENLVRRKDEIECMMRMINNSVNSIQEVKSKKLNTVFIEKNDCEYFWTFDTEPIFYENLKEFSEAVYKFRRHNQENDFSGEYFYTCFISDSDFYNKNYCVKTIAIKTDLIEKCTHLKAEGYYAVIYHKGNPKTVVNSLNKMKNFLEENNLEIFDKIYQTELVNNQITQNEEDYVTKISVPIKDNKNFRMYLNKK